MATAQPISKPVHDRSGGISSKASVTVRPSVVVTLTGQQVQLLKFFANLGDPPPVRPSRYDALHAQGLIYHKEDQSRYLITELGRQTVEALGTSEAAS